jgi:hypothetical protein
MSDAVGFLADCTELSSPGASIKSPLKHRYSMFTICTRPGNGAIRRRRDASVRGHRASAVFREAIWERDKRIMYK